MCAAEAPAVLYIVAAVAEHILEKEINIVVVIPELRRPFQQMLDLFISLKICVQRIDQLLHGDLLFIKDHLFDRREGIAHIRRSGNGHL